MRKLIYCAALLLFFFCGKLHDQKISIETYSRFWAECLLVKQVQPQDTPERRKQIQQILESYHLDSAKLDRFYKYFDKHPTEWVMVESLSQIKMEEISKKQKSSKIPR